MTEPVVAIPLYADDGALVAWSQIDFADAELAAPLRWSLSTGGYAVRNARWRPGAPYRPLGLHRFLLGLLPGDAQQVDHRNRDRLDNRRSNLRVVTPAQNAQNVPSHRDAASRFRGVCWDDHRGRWRAQVTLGGRQLRLGRFRDEVDAALAAEAWRQEHMPFAEPDHELVRAGLVPA